MKKSKSSWAICLVFALLIGVFSVWSAVSPARAYSENENRYLQQFPEFSAEALLSGKFTADFEKYITDQFPLRDGWISVHSLAERLLGKTDANGVYFGKDDYLIEQFTEYDRQQFEKNIAFLAVFAEKLKGTGVDLSVMLAPTASGVLTDKLPMFAPETDQSALIEYAENAGLPIFDPTEVLREHADEYIYYRTDHHWTGLGAYYAYAAWRAERGLPTLSLEEYTQEVLSDEFLGTTFSKCGVDKVTDIITAYYTKAERPVSYNLGSETADSIYTREHLAGKDKYSVFLNGNQAETVIQGDNPDGGTLLVIKDSYANTIVQFALSDYAEVRVVDLRTFKAPMTYYISQFGVTDVLVMYNLKGFVEDTNIFALAQ